MKHKQIIKLDQLKQSSLLAIGLYLVIASILITICVFPLLSELAYRKAHVLSTEAKVNGYKYIHRFEYAFDEFEKAMHYFPWETHYAVEYLKSLENYAKNQKNKEKKLKAYRKAITLLERIQFIDPINPWYHSKKSSITFELYKLTQKKDYLTQSLAANKLAASIDFENPIFLLNYANILHKNKQYSQAYYYYKKSIDIDKLAFPAAHFNIADIYNKLGKPEKALEHYLFIKKQRRPFKNIDATIIKHYSDRGQIDNVKQYIADYNLKASKDKNTLYTVTLFYFIQKDYQEAILYAERFLKTHRRKLPKQNKFYAVYIESLLKTNQRAKAVQSLERFIKRSPENNYLQKLLTKIK